MRKQNKMKGIIPVTWNNERLLKYSLSEEGLLDGNGFRQVTRLIDVGAFNQRDVIGE